LLKDTETLEGSLLSGKELILIKEGRRENRGKGELTKFSFFRKEFLLAGKA